MRRYDVETGLPPEAEAALKARIGVRAEGGRIVFFLGDTVIAELTEKAVLRAVAPNVLEVGDGENYAHKVVAANIVIPSRPETKKDVKRYEPGQLPELPEVIEYERVDGKGGRELGFDSTTAPSIVKTEAGDIELKALVALLVAKISRIEKQLYGERGP